MQINSQHLLKAVLIGLFILLFVNLHLSGDITKYINPKYEFMSKFAVGIFFILFMIQLPRIFQKKHTHHVCSVHCSHNHDHGDGHWNLVKIIGFAIVAFPIVTGFTIAPATLDSSIAANKGTILSQISSKQNEEKSLEESLLENSESLSEKEDIDIYSDDYEPLVNNNFLTDEELKEKEELLQRSEIIEMDEDIFLTYYSRITESPVSFAGRTLKLSGFVFKEGDFAANQLVLSRFLITHCVADASVIGFVTEFEGADQLKQDSWLEIEGVLTLGSYDGYELPIIKVTSWDTINEPNEPYLFPVQTWVQ